MLMRTVPREGTDDKIYAQNQELKYKQVNSFNTHAQLSNKKS